MILLVALALAGPEDALDASTRPFWERAVEEEDAHHPTRAAAMYRMVLAQDPAFVPASLGLGRALEASGQPREAEEIYRALPAEPDAVEALARLLEASRPAESLTLWRSLKTLRLGDPLPWREEARLLTPTDPVRALDAFRTHVTLIQGGEPDGQVLLALGDALAVAGEANDSEELWRGYVAAFPNGAVAADVRERLDRIDVERAADLLPLGTSTPLPPELAARRAEAERALAAGRVDAAVEEARQLVASQPRSADAHGLLADALVAQGAWAEAEGHAYLARVLAADDARHRMRYGLLLHEAYGGRRDAEAAAELGEAARLRPDEGLVRYHLGVIEQDAGAFAAALRAFDAFLASSPVGAEAEDARSRLAALRRVQPPVPAVPDLAAPDLPPAAMDHYRVAVEYLRRGRMEEATTELDAALAIAPDAPALLNQRAAIAYDTGAKDIAEAFLRRSLKVLPDQASTWLKLGEMARERDAARAAFVEAARLGSAEAHYHLASDARARGDWRAVRASLEAFDEAGGAATIYAESARYLRRAAETRLLGQRVGVGLGLVAGLGVPLAWWLRRRGARTLRDLLDGAPESWHEAARLLAGMRHEVLKHNTTVLPDVAAALVRGDRLPWDALSARMPDLLDRFVAYLGALETLGRRHGMWLDLRGKDPVLGPMFHAMRRLARAQRPPDDLLAISETINGAGYHALGRLVREIGVLPVDEALVRGVYARVTDEPGFAGAPLPELDVDARDAGLAVRMFRAELEDILANLLRNALAAGARTVRVVLDAADDPITGQSWVEVHVCDDAPGQLTNAMIRSRFIGRGLGLAVDLVNKHGGTIAVRALGQGEKAVVVQIPGVEAASVEVEWTAWSASS